MSEHLEELRFSPKELAELNAELASGAAHPAATDSAPARGKPSPFDLLVEAAFAQAVSGLSTGSTLLGRRCPPPKKKSFITGHGGPCSEGPSPLGLLKRPSSPKRAEARARSRRSPVRRGFLASAIRAASRCFTSSMSTYVAEGARA